MKFKIKIEGEMVEVDAQMRADKLTVNLDGRTLAAEIIEVNSEEIVLEFDGRRHRILRHSDRQQRQLWVNGQTFTYERIMDQAGASAANAGRLAADIPAVVSQILVKVGQPVTTGEKLILLESMKMVIPLAAPHDGTVSAIHCAPGEAVQPGVPLIDIEA